MRRTSSVAWIVSGCVGFLVGTMCSGQTAVADEAAAGKPANINVEQISHVVPGDTLAVVLREEGPPTDMKDNTYYYRQRGRIVFEGTTSPGDKTKVLRVENDPGEDGHP